MQSNLTWEKLTQEELIDVLRKAPVFLDYWTHSKTSSVRWRTISSPAFIFVRIRREFGVGNWVATMEGPPKEILGVFSSREVAMQKVDDYLRSRGVRLLGARDVRIDETL